LGKASLCDQKMLGYPCVVNRTYRSKSCVQDSTILWCLQLRRLPRLHQESGLLSK
jgi:hypothetical protein